MISVIAIWISVMVFFHTQITENVLVLEMLMQLKKRKKVWSIKVLRLQLTDSLEVDICCKLLERWRRGGVETSCGLLLISTSEL